jgi:hypothetical protein
MASPPFRSHDRGSGDFLPSPAKARIAFAEKGYPRLAVQDSDGARRRQANAHEDADGGDDLTRERPLQLGLPPSLPLPIAFRLFLTQRFVTFPSSGDRRVVDLAERSPDVLEVGVVAIHVPRQPFDPLGIGRVSRRRLVGERAGAD